MDLQINPGDTVQATDGPLGQVTALLRNNDEPNEPAYLVIQETAGSLLKIPMDVVEGVPTPGVVELNVSVELAREMGRATEARLGEAGIRLDLAEGVDAIQEKDE